MLERPAKCRNFLAKLTSYNVIYNTSPLFQSELRVAGPWALCWRRGHCWPRFHRCHTPLGAPGVSPTSRDSDYIVQSGFKSQVRIRLAIFSSYVHAPAARDQGELSTFPASRGDPLPRADAPQSGSSLRCCAMMTITCLL